MVRLPDFYMRLHPAGKADTLGASLLLTGLALLAGPTLLALKILLIEAFILMANPTATHAIARAAYRSGLPLWKPGGLKPDGRGEDESAEERK